MNNHDNEEKQEEQLGFLDAVQRLPEPLMIKFWKYCFASLLFLIVVIAILFIARKLQYLWGLIFTLYFLYLAMSLVWDWTENKIICQSMICVKATKKHGERIYLIMREADASQDSVEAIHKFHIPGTKQDLALITAGTIMTIYYNPRNLGELVAWEITGNK